jgi:nickel-dependent lactate racemase
MVAYNHPGERPESHWFDPALAFTYCTGTGPLNMRVQIAYGKEHLELEVAEERLIQPAQGTLTPALEDPAGAVRVCLEEPLHYPSLRQSLTPQDHVAIVVDESLPGLPGLLTPILEHIAQAKVAMDALTLICPPSPSRQAWLEELPDRYEEVRLEIHDPSDRKHLSYLATTKGGRRIYLNRTAVDADQIVVLSGRRYDPLLGISGAEGSLFPALSDRATCQELFQHLSMAAPGEVSWPAREEAAEVAWLMGAPFMVQIIGGSGDSVAAVLSGPLASSSEGQRLLDTRWRWTIPCSADTVVASVSGDPGRAQFADLARALACAARVVRSQGRIILLSTAAPVLESGADLLRQVEEPDQALALLGELRPPDRPATFQWAQAVREASVYLLSGLPSQTAEELFTVPLEKPDQVQRLISEGGSVLFLEDAHQALAVVQTT